GVLMIALYVGALIVTAFAQYRVARAVQFSRLAQCGAVILAADLGTAAMIFSFTPFVAQVGIQYWFLAGALHGVAQRYGIEGDYRAGSSRAVTSPRGAAWTARTTRSRRGSHGRDATCTWSPTGLRQTSRP